MSTDDGRTIAALPRLVAIVLLVGVAGGCRAADAVTTAVGDDSWVTMAPAPWQLRLAKPGAASEDPTALTVVRVGTQAVLATGPRVPDTVLAFVDDGRACQVRIDRQYEYDESTAPVGMKQPASRDLRTRTYRGIVATATCPGGAVPGTDGAARGSRSLLFLPWLALALVGGALAARLIGKDRVGAGLGVAVTSIASILGAGLGAIGPPFRLTSILALAGGGVLGWVAGAASGTRPRAAAAGGVAALVGALGIALAYPRWSVFGPVVAVVAGAGAMVVTMVVAVMLPEPRRR